MAVPKKKTSVSRRGMRRSHDALTKHIAVSACTNCGADHLPHNVCPSCGYYRGKQIVVAKTKEAEEINAAV